MSSTDKLIFVYGTLKSGGRLNNAMHRIGGKLAGVGRILSRNFVMRDLGSYPALQKVEPGSGDYIIGELWLVPVEGIKILDTIENYPHFYNRMSVDVWAGDPLQSFSAIVYYVKTDADHGTHAYLTQCPVIKSGEWDSVQNTAVSGHSSEGGETIVDTSENETKELDEDLFDNSMFTCDKGIYITSEWGELFGPYDDITDACNHITEVANELGTGVRMMTIGFRVCRRDLTDQDLVDLDQQITSL